MKVGVFLRLAEDMIPSFEKTRSMGMDSCQLGCWQQEMLTEAVAQAVRAASEKTGVGISAVWAGWPGPAVWDFAQGPVTLGIVPPAYRAVRVEALKAGIDFAAMLGVRDVVTHAGFLPENMTDPEYRPVAETLRELALYAKERGCNFLFETGQETPVTLLRFIEEVGTGNLGINLDPANLILYGKANPVDALKVFGKYVMGVHAKDGDYPTNGRELGQERRLGDGMVNFPRLIAALKEVGYDGVLTIEREIEGDEQTRDILYARDMLNALIAQNA